MRRRPLTLTLLVLCSLLANCRNSPEKFPNMESHVTAEPGSIVLQLEPHDGVFRSSEGAFLTLRSGRVLLYYSQFTGGYADSARAEIVSRFSDDGGRTWSPDDRPVVTNDTGWNVMSVSLLRIAPHRVALMYLLKNSNEDCRPLIRFSEDEARSWSAPIEIADKPGYYVVNNDRLVQLRSGRLIVPAAIHPPTPPGAPHPRGVGTFFLSDDLGQTWRRCKSTLELNDPRGHTGIQEPGLVELSDGRLFAWCRNDLGSQYGMFSTDAGESWTNPAPTDFISPLSPMSVKPIPGVGKTRDLLAIWNDHSGRFPINPEPGRQPLVSAISSDDGKTWRHHQQIESDLSRGYHYTAIHFVGDEVLLAYCAGPKGPGKQLNTLRVRRIPLAWFYQR
jgi:hypothetical protein